MDSRLSPAVRNIVRRFYDEHRKYVPIAPGMVNQIYRNGLLSKKTIDRDNYIRMQGSKNYYRDSRSCTPDGAIIVHRDDDRLHLGSCKAFAHPTYGSDREYRGEKGSDHAADITLAKLAASAEDCGFCSILYQGIQMKREFWILKRARFRWIDVQADGYFGETEVQQRWVEDLHHDLRGLHCSGSYLCDGHNSSCLSPMSRFAPFFGNYYAGLWQHRMLLSLQWEALDTMDCSRHKVFVAPSFSWASRSGPVIWYTNPYEMPAEETHYFATIVDVACTSVSKNPFGSISKGHITLRGFTTAMRIESKTLFAPDGRLKMTKKGAKECYVTVDSREDIESIQPGMSLICLDIMRDRKGPYNNYVSGLILLPVEIRGNHYRRIGVSTMLAEHFEDASLEEITII